MDETCLETGVQIYHMQNDCPISSLLARTITNTTTTSLDTLSSQEQ